MTDFEAINTSDFEADDFDIAEPYFPWAQIQAWVVLGDFTPEEVAICTFIMAHLNPLTGKMDANFGRRRIAERFDKSVDWVDKRLKALAEKGVLEKRMQWWVDRFDHSRGRSLSPTDEQGNKRAQAPNRYRIRLAPPSGQAHDGPINVGEFYRTEKIVDRISNAAGQRGAATQRPGYDQGKQDAAEASDAAQAHDQHESEFSQLTPQPPHSGPPQPPHSGPLSRPSAAQTTTGGTTTGGTTQDLVGVAADALPLDIPDASEEPEPAARQRKPRNASEALAATQEDWERFWHLYPRKDAKKDAQKAWGSAVRQGVDPDVMVEAAAEYAMVVKRNETPRDKVKTPAAWINSGRYEDEQQWAPLPDGPKKAAPYVEPDAAEQYAKKGFSSQLPDWAKGA